MGFVYFALLLQNRKGCSTIVAWCMQQLENRWRT